MTRKEVTAWIKSDPLKSATNQNNVNAILNQLNGFDASPETIENLARSGISSKNICSLVGKHFSYINNNPEILEAFNRGRANVGSRVRAKLLDAAIEDNSIPAAMYLDKIYSGETVASEVNVNVSTRPLEDVNTDDLLNVAFNVIDNGNETD